MSYFQLAHQLVDGARSGDLKAVTAVVGILIMTILSGYVTTRLTQWGTKKGWQALKWLTTPKPMTGLAKILYDALKRGKKVETGDGDLQVDKRIVFWGYPGKRPQHVGVYDRPRDDKGAEYTRLTHLLSRRDRRRLLKLAGWYRDCLVQERVQAEQKRACARGMAVAELIAYPTVNIADCDDMGMVPSAWGTPQPCRCKPETGETCGTCTGDAKVNNPSSTNGQAKEEKGPFELCRSTKRYECQCAGCKEARQTKWKRDDA